jgi:PAS domain S-box-containing protein
VHSGDVDEVDAGGVGPEVSAADGVSKLPRLRLAESAANDVSTLWFQALYETPLLYSGILDANGHVIGANPLAVEGCGFDRAEVLGRSFWTCGWWAPDPAVRAQVEQWVTSSLRSGQALRATSTYFVADSTPRLVDLCLTPLHDGQTSQDYLVVTGLDITGAQASQVAEDRAEQRLQRLTAVALELLNATTIVEVTVAVIDHGLSILGADGGTVLVIEPDGQLTVAISDRLGLPTEFRSVQLDPDSGLPGPTAIRTGQRIVVTDRESGLAFNEELVKLGAFTDRQALVTVPLQLGDLMLGALTATWPKATEFTVDDLALIDAFGVLCAQALERIASNRDQQESIYKVRQLAEALQRSMLTRPQTPDGLSVAVRYKPAAAEAEVGGDWYDVFTTASAATMLVVGDVTGHDRTAAAAMGQIRNLLRGMAYDSADGPSGLLTRLDAAVRGLRVNTLATALLAKVDAVDDDGPAMRRVHWSNAGHPPPILRTPDGSVRILSTPPDLLLGLQSRTDRTEHTIDLPKGSTLLLYTDGLVERRDASLDHGIEWLAGLVESLPGLDPELLCAAILASVSETATNDDVALLVLRCDS